MRKGLKKGTGLTLTSLIALSATAVPGQVVMADEGTETPDTISAQLLLVNDLHGKIDHEDAFDVDGDGEEDAVGGIQYLASYIEDREAENPNSLLVHSGDMVGGSPIVSSYFQDEPTVEIMEEMGFDVGTLGNHEFDEGVKEMLRMINGGEHPDGTEDYDGIDFPMVAANVQYKDTKELVIDPYTIEEVAGQKIGFIGVVTRETPSMIVSEGNENVEFTDESEAINKYVPELKEQGVEAIVVLAHNPGYQEGDTLTGDAAEIANKVDDEVDIIMAAHNHTENNAIVDDKLIVQAYSYGTAFADVDIEIDPETGDIVDKSAEVITNVQMNVEPDPEVSEILNKYEELVKPIKEEVVGQAAVDLEGGYGVRGEVGDNALGNLIADGMIEAMDADFSLMNGGGIRDDVSAGEITWGDLFDVQPFGNVLNSVELTGEDLEKVLNAQLSEEYGPDVSVGGFEYTWNGATNEVVNMKLPDGTPVKKNETYTVVVNNYMYGNADYRIAELGENKQVGPNDLQATLDYVKSFDEPITYEAEGRISEVATDSNSGGNKDSMNLPFSDVTEGTKAHETLQRLAENGVFDNVYGEETKSGDTLTRGQFVKMLANAFKLEVSDDLENPFEDTDDMMIAAAYEAGITNGVAEGKFAPDQELDRGHMAVLAINAFENMYGEITLDDRTSFKDEKKMNWKKDSILKGKQAGLYQGYSNGKFGARDEAKAMQGAYVIENLLNSMK
ncbi:MULTISPECIES: 5'-nucleotidase C-terminal domain-containing protein [Pontibacillus]|uniref:5'-nucleotidase C-terminal domain-containing protein n=1 Tax=Pontibacillus chungwhensis TaxID=265426 RepID=A0ABY8V099_9BACI|nr:MULTISPECIES: 5'-nucleotidase C-terminal domain-containing protein [Pontibacillus]MCD5324902.1 5'-nucleotidase C-terminal domain-containing protein [Pontibacillus sp. HN14]WIF98863.1 5'-nucleotidase C-terminal domain-containing protein [Pontibacillus chungwhensis]